MMRVLFATVKNNALELSDASGRRTEVPDEHAGAGRSSGNNSKFLVVISRLDYDVRMLSVPPVPRKEERSLIGFRIRALHPGTPESTVFDFRMSDAPGGGRSAVVYLMRSDVFEHYRLFAERGRLFTFDMIAASTSPPQNRIVLLRKSDYLERMVFEKGSLVESRLFAAGDESAGLAPAPEAITGDPPPIRVYVDEPRALQVNDAKGGQEGRQSLRDYERVRMPRSIAPLFRSRGPGRNRGGPLIAIGLSLVSAVLLLTYGIRTVDHYQRALRQAKARYESVATMYAGAAKDAQSYIATRTELQGLLENRPADVYRFFAALASALEQTALPGNEVPAFIENVTLANGTFALEGTGEGPFRLSELLEKEERFSSVRVTQIVPSGNGSTVRFALTGKYDGR